MTPTTDAKMGLKYFFGFCLAISALTAWGQTPASEREWSEDKAMAPPAYSADKLLLVEMPSYVTLKVGVDPATISVGTDDVVRYVVVMRNASGSVSAAFEGIKCTDGEVKTYARVNSTGGPWQVIEQPEWKSMTDNLPSRHAYAIAKQGACNGRTAGGKPQDIIRALQRGKKSYD